MDPHHRTNRQTWEFHGGEILGVTLFLVAINGILGELRNGVNGSLFADDLARPLQGVTNKLHAWAVERGLSFSTSKKVNIVFRKRRIAELKFCWQIDFNFSNIGVITINNNVILI